MENKTIFGILINLVTWPLIIYWLVKNNRNNKQFSVQQNEYNSIENKFKREALTLNLSLSLFSNRYQYPYVLTPSFSNRQIPKKAISKDEPEYYKFQNCDKITIGRSEKQLYENLCKRFGNDKIIFGEIILNGYYPDLMFIDKINSIYIDIEIDEPYSLLKNEPIHYFQVVTDDKGLKKLEDKNKDRDNVFLESGWTVVRFSEDQVVNSAEFCTDVINHIINYWLLKPSEFTFEKSKIIVQKRWTKDDAIKMSEDKYRSPQAEILKKSTDFDINNYLKD